jgi:hypothetical protein
MDSWILKSANTETKALLYTKLPYQNHSYREHRAIGIIITTCLMMLIQAIDIQPKSVTIKIVSLFQMVNNHSLTKQTTIILVIREIVPIQ